MDDLRPLYRNRDQRQGMTKREEAAVALAAALANRTGWDLTLKSRQRDLGALAVEVADALWDALDGVPTEAHDDTWVRP